jgi:PhnB protein
MDIYLIVKDAASAIEFYKSAFGATERICLVAPDGKVKHAEIKIGDSVITLADGFSDMGFRSPRSPGCFGHCATMRSKRGSGDCSAVC